jgi:hypothetical protein
MANFKKSDLKYPYQWDESKTGIDSVEPPIQSTLFLNSNDGHEMLLYINTYMALRNYSMLSTFHKIERAIKEELPKSIKEYNKVKRWLNDNCIL